MARINSNVGAVVAQRHLNRSFGRLNSTIERLSSGLRITRGADDPAGLIVSERLRAEVQSVNQAVLNTQRASLIVSTAEGALNEVSRLLIDVQDLIVEAANKGALSSDEIKANQLQVDSAINSITRIANTTTFAGRHLINGSLDYVTSGVDTTQINNVQINSAQFGTRSFIPVTVEVTTSAQPGVLIFPGSNVGSAVTVEVTGPIGATTLSFAASTPASGLVAAINSVSDATGVSAVLSGTGFAMMSQQLGSKNFVSVDVLPGGGVFPTQDLTGASTPRDEGRDAVGLINGAQTLGDGNNLSLRTPTLDMELALDKSVGLTQTSFAITEGGALFQVGPEVNSNLQVNIGLQSVADSRLGDGAVGFLSQVKTGGPFSLVSGNAQQSQRIIGTAIKQVAVLRGRLGAFEKNTLETNVNQLGITAENLMSAESTIRDADFARETANLSRDQILVGAGTSVLRIAQQTPQSVLSLLQ